VRHHQHRHLRLQRRERLVEPSCRGFVEAARRLVENQQLGQRIERVRQQHAAQLAARERRERAVCESIQLHAIEQLPNARARSARDTETNGTPLPRERKKVRHGDWQRAVNLELLRHVRDASTTCPMRDDPTFERYQPKNG
jgi:hypothetical protein